VILFNYFFNITYRSHLDITSIVGTSAFPKATTHLLPVAEPSKLLALFTNLLEGVFPAVRMQETRCAKPEPSARPEKAAL
jgi:hypothetical protein